MKSPLITMSALTGKPSENDVYLYMKDLKENGIDALLVYPRSGCQLEYLTEEWFSTVGYFISAARSLDMDLWLYDDFNWPSGDCKGEVTKNPEYRLMAICTRGENMGKISSGSRHNAELFGEKFFPNLLNQDAVDYFISLTHEEYYKRFGEYFGTVIKGFFTDEPSIGYCTTENSIPYYHGLKNDYLTAYGSSFDVDMKEGTRKFYKNAMTLLSKKFKSAYIDKLASWCKSHNIALTGHLMCDENPFGAVCHSGNFLENLSSFSKPGIDDIYTNLSDANEMILYGVAEYAGRKNGAMAELFALGPCDISYAKRNAAIFLCAAHKIDTYFLAISHLDVSGNMLVCDYFNDFDALQPDFIGMRQLSSQAKIAAEYAKKDYTPDLYIKFPTEITMENITKKTYYSALIDLINALTHRGIQWKFTNGDEKTPCVSIDQFQNLIFNGEKTTENEIISRFDKKLITDEMGEAVKGIFLRRFNDGTYILINLFAKDGTYLINGNPIYLREHQVVLQDTAQKTQKSEISCDFAVKYENPSVIRAMYINGEKTVQIVAENDTAVKLAVRNDTCAILDGKKITTTPSDTLPRAVRAYYGESEKILLTKGTHKLLCENDLKYMPSVLLVGDFDQGASFDTPNTVHLKKRKNTYQAGEPLCAFGTVAFEAKIKIPEGAKGISLDGVKLYTELYINGEKIGEQINAPYDFYFDKNFLGEAKLTVLQKTSVAPVFGNTKYWDENSQSVAWRGTPSTEKPLVGFEKIYFIK